MKIEPIFVLTYEILFCRMIRLFAIIFKKYIKTLMVKLFCFFICDFCGKEAEYNVNDNNTNSVRIPGFVSLKHYESAIFKVVRKCDTFITMVICRLAKYKIVDTRLQGFHL